MKTPAAGELKEGQAFQDALFAVSQVGIQYTRYGEPFLYLRLHDVTGAVDARQFKRAELPDDFAPGDVVRVTGSYSTRFGIQLESVRAYDGSINVEDFLPKSPRDINKMSEEAKSLVGKVKDTHLQKLVEEFFTDAWNDFQKWPGAQEVHHSYLGGLLEHSLAVMRLLDTYADLYPVNRELVVVGALLHDVGKLDELTCKATIVYTNAGRLFGHTYLGTKRLERYAIRVHNFPKQLQDQLCHMILSHHGALEWGAVVTPMTLEAFLLHAADFSDTRAARYETIAKEQRQRGLAVGPYDRFLRTRVYSPEQEAEDEADL